MLLNCEMETHAKGRVRVSRLGTGPPLVLLHGYPDNLQIFCALAPRLTHRFTVIAVDWPGMGWSDVWPGGTTPDHMADRLIELLDAWRIDRASLAAMDMGGQPALSLAARHPGRVDRLVIMNSLVLGDEETSWEIRLLRRYRWNEWVLRSLPRVVFWRAVRTSLPSGARLPAALREDLWQGFRRPDVRRFVSRMCGGYQGALPRLAELYPRIRCPTLILWGECDRHFPLAQARGLHAAIPGAELAVLEGAEHWMAWHRAGDVAARIAAFQGGQQHHPGDSTDEVRR
jgi:pimeloyl-ACP methyl ester carboxylesterase